MFRLLPILLVACATPAAAYTLDCKDPAGDLTYFEIVETFDGATGAYALVSTRLQIMEEMTYTSADDPVNGGDISFVNVVQDPSTLDFDLHLLNPEEGYDVIVASVRLNRTQHGAQEGIGGTLNVGGGGAFGVACSKREG